MKSSFGLAVQALRSCVHAEVTAVAQGNAFVSRREQRSLSAFLDDLADQIRAEGGRGARVRVDVLVERAVAEAVADWADRVPWLDEAGVRAVEAARPALGLLTRKVAESLRPTQDIRAWFEAFDFRNRRFSVDGLPKGARVDAREGQPERHSVPGPVLAAFDFYFRAEQRDVGSVSLHRGVVAGRAVWAVYTSTDGDDAYLEVLDEGGRTLEGARLMAGELVAWDDFDQRVRLSAVFLRLDDPAFEEGMSEPEERAAAGQPPMGWGGARKLLEGELRGRRGFLVTAKFGEPALAPPDRNLAIAAFDYLWDVHLRHAANRGKVTLGPNAQGVLTIGPFVRCTTGERFLVADWRDIDDGSYVLYFRQSADRLVLATVQFDN